MSTSKEFDVFLCHNSQDKAEVEKIREQLKKREIYAWLDKYDFEPFRPWQDQLQEIIPKIKAVGVFIGSSGVGPWANIEMKEFLVEFVNRKIRMGLVILPGCSDDSLEAVPRFMNSFHRVDFRHSDPDPIEQLIWGITGSKPSFKSKRTALTIQKEQRTVQYFREKLGNDIDLDMILVHGGNFLMGSPETEEERDDESQHPVIVKSFFLGRYPVTQEQWRIVAETYDQVNIELKSDPSYFKGAKLPVEQVAWYEAQEYCDRLAQKTKRPYRLPTEAEWEYGCRAGTTTPFYFGNTISTELANYDGNYIYANGVKGEHRNETTPVDHSKIANAWGLCDMHGNVSEWCQDYWHDKYEGAPEDGSVWLTLTDNSETFRRVWRGGSWFSDPLHCRSAYRFSYNLDYRNYALGFRVSCSAPATLQPPTDQS